MEGQEREILQLIYDAHHFLDTLESTPRDYGTGDLLYSSDIHTVTAVHRNPMGNLTSLAEGLKISKAAASKFVKKLSQLGYLNRTPSPRHGREVLFSLTDKGEAAVMAHQQFEKKVFGPLFSYIAQFNTDEKAVISRFLEGLKQTASLPE